MTDTLGHVSTALPQTLASYGAVLTGALDEWKAVQGGEVNGFIARLFSSSGIYASSENAESAAREVIRTIEASDQAYQSLKAHRAAGGTRAGWIEAHLAATAAQTPGLEAGELAAGLQQGLLMWQGASKPAGPVDLQAPAGRALLKGLADDIQNATMLGAVSFDQGGFAVDTTHGEIQVLEGYFRDQLESPEDTPLRKVVSAATVIAAKKGFLPPLSGKSATEITLIVDRGLLYAKVAFKVANGDLKLADAVDYMIDRTAAAVGAAVTRAAETVSASAGAKVGAIVGAALGPAGAVAGAMIGRTVGALAGRAVGGLVSQGVQFVANKAKDLAREAISAAGEVLSSAVSRVASFFGF